MYSSNHKADLKKNCLTSNLWGKLGFFVAVDLNLSGCYNLEEEIVYISF